LDFAKAIGAKNISITSGRCLAGMPPQLAEKQFAESIWPILDRADKLDVNVGIECEPGLFLEYATELREWIDRIKSPRLGANLDIGHSQVLGEDLAEAITLLGDRIWNLHVEDIPGRKHYGYQRFATVELYTHTADPQKAAEQSWRFLSQKLFG
jgi:sugar phosphate isomerase/epimerase